MTHIVQSGTPVYRDEDGELMGSILQTGKLWIPCTVFGHPLHEPMARSAAERFLQTQGLELLLDGWQFCDDGDWYNCTIVEANPGEVTIRITDYGHPAAHQLKVLEQPDDTVLRRR